MEHLNPVSKSATKKQDHHHIDDAPDEVDKLLDYYHDVTPCQLTDQQIREELREPNENVYWRCQWDGTECQDLKALRAHVLLMCDLTCFKCPLCGISVRRNNMLRHLRDECRKTTVYGKRNLHEWFL